ncbi:MAG TPA: peptide deformylase [Gaiellaceae bacterium]
MSEHDHDHDDELDVDEEAERDAEREARKRLALAQIRQYGDTVLRMQANEVEAFDDELARVAERMLGLMHDAEGVGLAATQVGILRRVFVFSDGEEDHVLVNPVVARDEKETETEEEGCLSLGPVRVPVERAVRVTIEAQDAAGAPVRLELEGLPARVVQHELDHLDGVLIIDRTDPESRREALALLRPRIVLT